MASTARILAEEPVDLLILCHTLSPEDRAQAIALTSPKDARFRRMHKLYPKIKHLVLTAAADRPKGDGSDILSALGGPAQLVSPIQTLTGDGSTSYSHFF